MAVCSAGVCRKDLAQDGDELGLAIGLAQYLELLALEIVTVHQLLGIPGREQDSDARSELAGPRGHLTARHATRHDQVREDEIDRVTSRQDVERLGPIAGFQDVIPDQLEFV